MVIALADTILKSSLVQINEQRGQKNKSTKFTVTVELHFKPLKWSSTVTVNLQLVNYCFQFYDVKQLFMALSYKRSNIQIKKLVVFIFFLSIQRSTNRILLLSIHIILQEKSTEINIIIMPYISQNETKVTKMQIELNYVLNITL